VAPRDSMKHYIKINDVGAISQMASFNGPAGPYEKDWIDVSDDPLALPAHYKMSDYRFRYKRLELKPMATLKSDKVTIRADGKDVAKIQVTGVEEPVIIRVNDKSAEIGHKVEVVASQYRSAPLYLAAV